LEKKREDKIQFDKVLAKTLALEREVETLVTKKVLRRDLTSEELDQEFQELNSGQIKANARLAIEELAAPRGAVRKKKSTAVGRRMMRAEEEKGDNNRLPPVSVMLSRGDVVAWDNEVENVEVIRKKRENKTVNIPESVVEEMDLEIGEDEENFQKEQRNEVRVEIPQDILKVVERSVLTLQGGEGEVESLSTTFLQNLVSDRMEIDLGEKYDQRVQEIVQDFEESGREAGLTGSPSRYIKEELIEREEISRESRSGGVRC